MNPAAGEQMVASRLDPVVRDRLNLFAKLLVQWNATIKLVSTRDVTQLWWRHIEDALQLIPHMPTQARHAVDLGSGGGFPGLVLAIATEVHFDLIESDSRKAAFLQEAAAITRAPATIHPSRIEDVSLGPRLLVTARALAPLPKLLKLAQPFLSEGSVCLFHKGQRAETEIAEAREDWIMGLQQLPSHTSPTGRIFRITGLRHRESMSA